MDEIEFRKHILPPIEFGERLTAFREKHKLSLADFSRIFRFVKNTSPATFHRVEKGLAARSLYETVSDVMEDYLPEWLKSKGFSDAEIYADLDQLFNLQERDMIVKRRELTSSAIKFFGLSADPFDVDRIPSDEELFTNKDLDELVAQVRDAVLYKKWIAVEGPIGSGKTALKIRLHRELSELKTQKIYLIYPEFFDMNVVTVQAIANCILEEFQIKVPNSKTARVRRIKEHLVQLEKEDARVALIFDECHRLNDKVLTSLKNFWEMTNGGYSRLLGIVLFGQPQFFEATLRDVRYREISERVKSVQMPSLSKSAKDYLAHRIAAVGGNIDALFEPNALKRICNIAKTPLSLGNIANHALMEAFEIEEPRVVSQILSKLNLPDEPRIRSIRQAA